MVEGVVLKHKGKGFSFDPRTRQKIEFTTTHGGWDLTMKSEQAERANKIMNKAIQEIRAKKRAAAVAKDYGAVTETDGSVRIMGCDPFRRPGIGLLDQRFQQMTLSFTSFPSASCTSFCRSPSSSLMSWTNKNHAHCRRGAGSPGL